MRMIWRMRLNSMVSGFGAVLCVSLFLKSNLLILSIFNINRFDEYPTWSETTLQLSKSERIDWRRSWMKSMSFHTSRMLFESWPAVIHLNFAGRISEMNLAKFWKRPTRKRQLQCRGNAYFNPCGLHNYLYAYTQKRETNPEREINQSQSCDQYPHHKTTKRVRIPHDSQRPSYATYNGCVLTGYVVYGLRCSGGMSITVS